MSKAVLIFTIAVVSTVLWVVSLVVRRKNVKLGVVLSWSALILMALAVVLFQVLKDN